jgi:hypothetical protein
MSLGGEGTAPGPQTTCRKVTYVPTIHAANLPMETPMSQTRNWQGMRRMSVRLLKERTGEDVDVWNRRIKRKRFQDEKTLCAWLAEQGVTS